MPMRKKQKKTRSDSRIETTKTKRKTRPQRRLLIRENVAKSTSTTSSVDSEETLEVSNKQSIAKSTTLSNDTVHSTDCEVASLDREPSIILRDPTEDFRINDIASVVGNHVLLQPTNDSGREWCVQQTHNTPPVSPSYKHPSRKSILVTPSNTTNSEIDSNTGVTMTTQNTRYEESNNILRNISLDMAQLSSDRKTAPQRLGSITKKSYVVNESDVNTTSTSSTVMSTTNVAQNELLWFNSNDKSVSTSTQQLLSKTDANEANYYKSLDDSNDSNHYPKVHLNSLSHPDLLREKATEALEVSNKQSITKSTTLSNGTVHSTDCEVASLHREPSIILRDSTEDFRTNDISSFVTNHVALQPINDSGREWRVQQTHNIPPVSPSYKQPSRKSILVDTSNIINSEIDCNTAVTMTKSMRYEESNNILRNISLDMAQLSSDRKPTPQRLVSITTKGYVVDESDANTTSASSTTMSTTNVAQNELLWFNSNDKSVNASTQQLLSKLDANEENYYMSLDNSNDSNRYPITHLNSLRYPELLREKATETFSSKDLGIVPVKQLSFNTSHARAILRCAWINHSTAQTVLYWCEECDHYSYNAQIIICLEIKKQKKWVTEDIPFADAYNTEGRKLVFKQDNDYSADVDNRDKETAKRFGIYLFHYTTSQFQTKEQMLHTGKRIALEVNDVSKSGSFHNIRLEIDDEHFFLYDDSCVWSNLLSVKDCIGLLKRELGMSHNDSFDRNFWDNNKEIMKSYFFPGTLSFSLAEMFNAPDEEIAVEFPRTPAFLQSVAQRRHGIVRLTNDMKATSELSILRQVNINPVTQVNYLMPKDHEFLNSISMTTLSDETYNEA